MTHGLRAFYAQDHRALAAFRIALGLTVLADVALRLRHFARDYSQDGAIPSEHLMTSRVWGPLAHGTDWQQALVFVLLAAAALLLTVGWRSRVAAAVAWVALTCVQTRQPALLYGADYLLSLLLFWSVFVPLGARWSLERRRTNRGPDATLSIGTLGLQIQVALMYVATGFFKTSAEWSDGTALALSLSREPVVRPFGRWLLEFPNLLALGTPVIPPLEIVAPLLLFLPFLGGRLRTVGVVVLVGLQLGLALCFDIFAFSWTSIVAMIPFTSARLWKHLESLVLRRPAPPRPAVEPGQARRYLDLGCEIVAAGSLVLLLSYNVLGVIGQEMPRQADRIGRLLGLRQTWAMFGSFDQPVTWLFLVGVTEKGQSVPLRLQGSGVALATSGEPRGLYDSDRSRSLSKWLIHDSHEALREPFARWVCRQPLIDSGPGDALVEVELRALEKLLSLSPDVEFEERVLLRQRCRTAR